MQKFYIYQDSENCFYCTEIKSKIKNWILVGTFKGRYSLKPNDDFDEFKIGSTVELTNKKNVIIEEITWIKKFTFADFKNFNFRYGQKVMTKDGNIYNLLSVNFEISDTKSHCINVRGNDRFDRMYFLDLSDILYIYTPRPLDLSKYGISLQ